MRGTSFVKSGNSGSPKSLLKLLLAPIIIVYLLLQIMITAKTSGISFRRLGHTRQYFHDKTSSVSFVTKSINNTNSDDAYLKLMRVADANNSNNFQSTCSSHVRLLRGFQRKTKGFVTLGLSTVPRDSAFYLPQMLTSLISKITEKDKEDIVIVIFLGSHIKQWVNMTLNMIDVKFADSVRDGIIQVVQPEQKIYPDFKTITKRNFNDSLKRVYWRTKQNIDYSYLFAYCDQLSKYYMHIEDDISTANDFMMEIRTFVSKMEKSKDTWFVLEFSTLGFIGKLFRSSDLCTMKDYFLLFKDEKPCDLLINNLKNIKTQSKNFRSPRSLFQHFGIASSLKGKIQKLTDRNFKDNPKKQLNARVPKLQQAPIKEDTEMFNNYKSNTLPNPAAKIYTSMQIHKSFSAIRPYSVDMNGYLWAKSPNASDFYRIVFDNPVNITEINIKTGHPTQKLDRLQNAVLKVGYFSEEEKCNNSIILGSFKDGQFTSMRQKPLQLITCLEIFVVKGQKEWLIIYEIIIHTTETETEQSNKQDGNVKRRIL